MLLEAASNLDNAFVTLTYKDPQYLPPVWSLNPKHTQEWLKRLREKMGGGIRFYLVGEYGDETFRPHYHAALFGYPSCLHWSGSDPWILAQRAKCLCLPCETLRKSWGHGKTDNGQLTPESAQYLAGYVLKKMTQKTDPRLCGRHPEFARQSNGGGRSKIKGGIGAVAVPAIADVLTSEYGVLAVQNNKDIPLSLNQGKKSVPLGRYLRSKLRSKIAGEKGVEIIKKEAQMRHAKEVFEMCASYRENQVSEGFKSAGEITLAINAPKVLQVETRSKIFSKKGSL